MFPLKRYNDPRRIYVENQAIEWNKKDLLSKVPWCFSRRKTYPDSPYQQKHTRARLYQNENSPSISKLQINTSNKSIRGFGCKTKIRRLQPRLPKLAYLLLVQSDATDNSYDDE